MSQRFASCVVLLLAGSACSERDARAPTVVEDGTSGPGAAGPSSSGTADRAPADPLALDELEGEIAALEARLEGATGDDELELRRRLKAKQLELKHVLSRLLEEAR